MWRRTILPSVGSVGAKPLVSVFTAAHEIGAQIETAHRSLQRQTYSEWDWVVIDDSAGLRTGEHLARLADAESAGRIRLMRHEGPPGSIGAAKAAAAGASRGEFLVELDHDDELLPEALELITATFIAHPKLDFVFSDWIDWQDLPGGGVPRSYPPGWGLGFGAYASEVIDGRRVPVALAPPLTWETTRHIVSVPNHVRAWRADFYRAIGGHSPKLPVGDDYELLLRTFLKGSTARIPRPLYVQHHDPAGNSASRRRNPEIQQRVTELARRHREAIDRRCLSLGAPPSPQSPLTGHEVLGTASEVIDVVAQAAASRGAPLVSVAVPTYRRPELLERALASISAQSYENHEVLVVGDCCPCIDEVIETIGDPRVRHWNLPVHSDDSGASPRNYALKTMARGTLIAYLDDDNRWRPDHLESLVELLLSNPQAQFAFASLEIRGEPIICRRPRRMQIDTSALLHHRSLLDRFGYWRGDEGVKRIHDWELVSRWADQPWVASLAPSVVYTLERSPRGDELFASIKAVAEEERQATAMAVGGR
jgi:glycosyltransferase involved in cell wall biosynthesis